MSETFSPLFPKVRYKALSISLYPALGEPVKIVLAKASGTEEMHSGNMNRERQSV